MKSPKKVILVRFDHSLSEGFRAPLGLLYVADALNGAGYESLIFHELGSKRTIKELVRLVETERPLFVGFTVETGPCIGYSVIAATQIKAATGIPCVWGGIHASSLKEQTAAHPAVDYVVVGEGEETVVDLAHHIAVGGSVSDARDIPGLAFCDGEEYVETPARPFIQDLDRYWPAFHLVDNDRYFKAYGARWPSLFTSRGCPFKCAFCYIVATRNNKLREHSVDYVLDQLEWLKKHFAITGINFYDDEFFLNKRRSMELIGKLSLPWSAFPRINDLKDYIVEELAKTKCLWLHAGAESGNNRILQFIQKGQRVEDIRRSVALLHQHRVPALLNFICGFPTETWDEMMDTVDFMRELKENYPSVLFRGPKIYTPYPNTPLYDEALRLGFRPPQSLEGWANFKRYVCNLPYVQNQRILESLHYYCEEALKDRPKASILRCKLGRVANWRWRKHYFAFPVEYVLHQTRENLREKAQARREQLLPSKTSQRSSALVEVSRLGDLASLHSEGSAPPVSGKKLSAEA